MVDFQTELVCPILASTFPRNRRGFRTWDQFHRIEGTCKVANHTGFLSIVEFHAGNLCPILVSTFSRNRRCFRTWDQFHRMQGTCKGGQSQRIFFLPLVFKLEIYVHFCGQRFLETGEVSGPGTNSIEQRGPVRIINHTKFSFYL